MREQLHRDRGGLVMGRELRRYLDRQEETRQKRVETRKQRKQVSLPKLKFMEDDSHV